MIKLESVREIVKQQVDQTVASLASLLYFHGTNCTWNQSVWCVGVTAGARLRAGDGKTSAEWNCEVRSGNHSFGQGLETTIAQVASEQLGTPHPKTYA